MFLNMIWISPNSLRIIKKLFTPEGTYEWHVDSNQSVNQLPVHLNVLFEQFERPFATMNPSFQRLPR